MVAVISIFLFGFVVYSACYHTVYVITQFMLLHTEHVTMPFHVIVQLYIMTHYTLSHTICYQVYVLTVAVCRMSYWWICVGCRYSIDVHTLDVYLSALHAFFSEPHSPSSSDFSSHSCSLGMSEAASFCFTLVRHFFRISCSTPQFCVRYVSTYFVLFFSEV